MVSKFLKKERTARFMRNEMALDMGREFDKFGCSHLSEQALSQRPLFRSLQPK
jgi:hypothetical protein